MPARCPPHPGVRCVASQAGAPTVALSWRPHLQRAGSGVVRLGRGPALRVTLGRLTRGFWPPVHSPASLLRDPHPQLLGLALHLEAVGPVSQTGWEGPPERLQARWLFLPGPRASCRPPAVFGPQFFLRIPGPRFGVGLSRRAAPGLPVVPSSFTAPVRWTELRVHGGVRCGTGLGTGWGPGEGGATARAHGCCGL